jgi:TRAP-type C4-dicarboxylate transport system permease small subunit
MRFLSALRNILNGIAAPAASGLAGAGILALVAMMVVVTLDVILRYVFNQPTVWAGEVASFLTIAVVFLGLAQNMRLGDHIRIDILTGRLPARTRLFLDVAAHAIAIVFAVVLFWGCWVRFDNFWVRQTVSDSPLMIPLWLPMLPVLAGAAIFCLAAVGGFVTRFHALLGGDPIGSRNPKEKRT